MAITSSPSSTTPAAAHTIIKKTKKARTVLTSPFFKHNRVIRDVFSGAESAPIGCYHVPITDPVTNKVIKKELKINPKPSSEMFACQKAMYIILTDIDRIRKRANQSVLMAVNSQLYKRNFSGIFDNETQILVGRMQIAFNDYYENDEDEETDIHINVDNRIGPITLDEMDKRLEMIKYYDSSDHPFIYHAEYVCEDADYIVKPYNDHTYLFLKPERPAATPGNPDAPLTYVKKRKDENGQMELIKLIKYQTKIIIMRDVNNFNADWFYAKVLLKKPGTNDYYFEDGYINRLDLLPRLTSMPDPDAELIEVLQANPNHDSVYDIIQQHYYTNNGLNALNMPLVYVEPSDPESDAYEHYTCFKFYVNLLLYANNPEAANSSVVGIYLKTAQALDNDWLDGVNSRVTYTNVSREAYYSNYRYFLKLVKEWHNGAHWEYSGTNTIVVKDGFHLWVPSPGFANRLYAVVNDNRDFLTDIAHQAISAIQTRWPRGFGVELDGTLAAKFGFFTGEVGMKFKISRKHTDTPQEVTLIIEKEGKLAGGVEAGVGVGIKAGAGQRHSGQDYPAGLGADASVGAQLGLTLRTEYEFPIVVSDHDINMMNDYVLWPLLMTFASVIPNPMELIGYEFLKGFIDNNLNPNNYLTKVSFTQDIRAYGEANGGFSLGDSHGEDLWTSGSGEYSTRDNSAWDIRNLSALLNLQLGTELNAQFAVGFTYEATYDEFCFDRILTKRIPRTFKLAAITNASLTNTTSLYLANWVVPIADFEPTASFELSIGFERPSYFITPSVNYLLDEGAARITLLAGYGNWSITNRSSTILGIAFKKMTQIPQTVYELVSHIDYFSLKKRINIQKMNVTGHIPVIARKKAKNMRVSNMSISAGIESFYEVEFRIPNEVVLTMQDELVKILQKTKHDLYDAVQNISWIGITTSIANNLTPTINTKLITADLRKLYNMLLCEFRYDNVASHGEMAFSAGLEAKFAVLAKLSFELNGTVILSYDKTYMEDADWRTLSPAVESIECARIQEYFELPEVKNYLLGLS
jgi:hypothetical protein